MMERMRNYLEKKSSKTAEEYQLLSLLVSGTSLETIKEFRSDLMETVSRVERESR